MRLPNFIGGSYPSQSPTAALERSINFYPEVMQTPGGKHAAVLYPTPGVRAFQTTVTGATPVRGLWAQNSRCFAVIGTTLYEVSSLGVLTSRGTVAVTATEPAYITSNGDGGLELFVVSGDAGYALDLTTNVLTTPVASGITMASMLDGFILALNSATSTFSISNLNDATTWNALQFQQRTSAPDRWVSLAVAASDIWLLGEETSEAWYNAGTSPFPFQPHPNGLIPFGCAAPHSVRASGDNLLWVTKTRGGQGEVVMSSGLSVQVVSTQAMAWVLSQYSTITDAVAETYDDQGHRFYKLTFPTANATWVYDLTTSLWHERGTWSSVATAYAADRTLYHCFAFGKHLVGDRSAGTIYESSVTAYTDVEGLTIRRVRQAPVLSDEHKRVFYTYFDLDVETGLGNVVAPGNDPQVTLEFSNDNGKTWGGAPTRSAGTATAGAMGEYGTIVRWQRLGATRNRVFRVVMTDPIPWRLINAYIGIRPAAGT